MTARFEGVAIRLLVTLLIALAMAETLRVLANRTALWLTAERDLVAAEGELRAAWRAVRAAGAPGSTLDAETPPDRSGGAVGPSLNGGES
jgi:hypothetical protein